MLGDARRRRPRTRAFLEPLCKFMSLHPRGSVLTVSPYMKFLLECVSRQAASCSCAMEVSRGIDVSVLSCTAGTAQDAKVQKCVNQRSVRPWFWRAALEKHQEVSDSVAEDACRTTAPRHRGADGSRHALRHSTALLLRWVHLLVEKPVSIQVVGAGRRASTLRSRVRLACCYLLWRSMNIGLVSKSASANLATAVL